MSINATALRGLHRIHRQLNDLRDRLERGPKQVHAVEASMRKMEMEREQTREANKRIRVQADEKQLQLRERENRIEDLQSKLNSCGSNREYQALKERIAADKQANSVLADEILEALDRLEQLSEKVKGADENLARVKAESAKIHQRVESEQQSLAAEMERVRANLAQAEVSLPSDFKAEYQRLTRACGEAALAEVDGEVCGGCYHRLTPQTMNELYLGKPVFCKSCGCLMYLPEGRSAESDS
ncbi:MAG: zinc ribbon domain-containing protein [Pirellulaceae bacterium]